MPSARKASASSTVATPSSAARAANAARASRSGAVAVPVGLYDGHDLRAAGVFAQHPHVVLDGTQVHHGLGEDARGSGLSA